MYFHLLAILAFLLDPINQSINQSISECFALGKKRWGKKKKNIHVEAKLDGIDE
jgi:hypothetical protein